MALLSIPELLTKASAAFKRFPITLVWAIAGSFFVVTLIELDDSKLFDKFLNVFLVLALGISWLISVQFYIEQFKNSKKYWWLKGVVLLFLLAVYFTLPEPENRNQALSGYVRYTLFLIAGHLALFFTQFTYSWHPKSYANYLGTILLSLARSALFAGVLYLGLILALAAVDFLFNVDIDAKRYGQLFVLCVGIVNTWVYLSDFPKEVHHNIHFSFPKPAEVFVKYILIPLVALYFIILYAYSLKIIVNWELPKGWVSYLVTALAGLLFVIQLIINPIQKSHPSRLIRKFHPVFYWLLLPLLVLLYAAIYRRTSEYGITENRYFVWVLAIYITAAVLYLIFSKKRQLRWLPIGLFSIAMLTSVGPWGASAVSERSQLGAFKDLYEDAFAKAQSQEKTITREAYNRLQSIARYLADRNALDQTAETLGYVPSEIFKNESSYALSYKVIDSLGLHVEKSLDPLLTNYYNADTGETLEAAGFDYYKRVSLNKNKKKTPYNQIQNYHLRLAESGKYIHLFKEDSIFLEIPLDPLIKKLKAKGNQNSQLPRELLMVQGENAKVKVKIYFENISLAYAPSKGIDGYAMADVFLKDIIYD